MKKLKRYLLLLALFLSVSSQVWSESYYITEEQLQILEEESERQRQMCLMLQQQLQDCQNHLTEAEESLSKSEDKKWIQILEGVGVGLAVGLASGVLIGVSKK